MAIVSLIGVSSEIEAVVGGCFSTILAKLTKLSHV